MSIRVLDAALVGQIAAGEVVERPSSVAKEMIENALDAGATSITVEIREGGTTFLRVTDNGCGIAPSEVRLAFENHATSKLQEKADLMDIRTLGFRGEALPSIAAVAKIEMTTRVRGAETGTKIAIEGGHIKDISETGCPEGTNIIVRDLFFNVPARKAFLKKPTYEAGVMSDMVSRLMLGNPGIAIRLISNGKTLFHTFGDGNLRHTALAIYGREVAEKLIDIDVSEGGLRIWGLVGIGDAAKPTRTHQSFFVNGRLIRCLMLTQELEAAAKERVTIGMHPMCALNLTLAPHSVDVNVHPNKLEVRFRDEYAVRTAVERMLTKALAMRMFDPAMQQFENKTVGLIPEVDFAPPPVAEEQTEVRDKQTEVQSKQTEVREKKGDASQEHDPKAQASFPDKPRIIINDPEPPSEVLSEFDYLPAEPIAPVASAEKEPLEEKQSSMEGILPAENVSRSMQFRVIGVVFQTYLVVEYESSLLLIDQHAAHERLIYERYRHLLESGSVAQQQLLMPIVLSVTTREMALIDEHEQVLREIGYEIEPFGERDIRVSAVPYVLGDANMKMLFLGLIDQIGMLRAATVQKKKDELIQFSCKHAVKAGDVLLEEEVNALISDMKSSGAPPTCPHGRPVMKVLTKGELERMFKRRQ